MTAAAPDIRKWLKDNDYDPPARGAIPQHLRDEYDRAHDPAVIPGDVLESDYPLPEDVTAADFPPEPAAEEAAPKKTRERAPRKVTPKGKKTRIWDRIAGKDTGPKKARPKQPRVSLSDFAEETWEDLAWLAQPVPPLARMLALQAPYAGTVLDEQVKGTPVDYMLQPLAKYSTTWRALNGLIGPPLAVGMICAEGKIDPETGQMDGRTAMLFGLLKFSLLQMVKISDLNAEQIQARVQASAERNQVVDAMIAGLFPDLFPSGPEPEAPSGDVPAPPPAPAGTYTYPEPPQMDGTGARRM